MARRTSSSPRISHQLSFACFSRLSSVSLCPLQGHPPAGVPEPSTLALAAAAVLVVVAHAVTIGVYPVLALALAKTAVLDEVMDCQAEPVPQEHRDLLAAVLELPAKYKDVVYLHYFEGYTAGEIGKLLHKNPNTVYTWLERARKLLKSQLEGGDYHG